MTVHASRPAPAIVRRHAGCSLSQDKPRARCQGYFPAYRAPRRRGRTRLWRSEPRHQRMAVARPEAHGDTAMCAESPQAFLVAERGPPSQRDRAPYTLAQRVPCCRLTVKLRGRATEPDWSRGRNISPSARGDTTELHGPLQRLLDGDCRHSATPIDRFEFLSKIVPHSRLGPNDGAMVLVVRSPSSNQDDTPEAKCCGDARLEKETYLSRTVDRGEVDGTMSALYLSDHLYRSCPASRGRPARAPRHVPTPPPRQGSQQPRREEAERHKPSNHPLSETSPSNGEAERPPKGVSSATNAYTVFRAFGAQAA